MGYNEKLNMLTARIDRLEQATSLYLDRILKIMEVLIPTSGIPQEEIVTDMPPVTEITEETVVEEIPERAEEYDYAKIPSETEPETGIENPKEIDTDGITTEEKHDDDSVTHERKEELEFTPGDSDVPYAEAYLLGMDEDEYEEYLEQKEREQTEKEQQEEEEAQEDKQQNISPTTPVL